MTNSTVETILTHRSIRRFQDAPVPADQLETLIKVALRTPSSTNMQSASIIRVTDPAKKAKLAEIAKQPYIADAPEIWQFFLDVRRMAKIAEEKGGESASIANMDLFFQGWTDASLMAQNVATSAESMGLGTCLLGSPLNNPPALIELYEMPELTFPVVGLMMGLPNQEPMLKPRMGKNLRFFENTYQDFSPYVEALSAYDNELQTYYDVRQPGRPVASYTDQVAKRMSISLPLRQQIVRTIRAQGFNLDLG